MKRIAIAAACLSVGACHAEAVPTAENAILGITKTEITFKGVPLGVPGSRSQLKDLCQKESENSRDPMCNDDNGVGFLRFSYGNIESTPFLFSIDERGAINRVSKIISREDAAALIPLLKEKYGQPKEEVEIVENGLGTKFGIQTSTWRDQHDNEIEIESRLRSDLTRAGFTLTSGLKVRSDEESRRKKEGEAKINL